MKKTIFATLLSVFVVLPFHLSAQWNTSGTSIYNSNSGNVGIGKTNPGFKLDVNGTIHGKNIEMDRSTRIGSGLSDTFTYDNKTMSHYSLGWFEDSWSSPAYGAACWLSGYGGIKLFTAGNPRFVINARGNVGIGKTNPGDEYKLDVAGNISAQGAGDVGPIMQLTNLSKTGNNRAMYWRIFNMTGEHGNSLQFWAYDERNTSGSFFGNRFTITDDGKVGIGTGSPGTKLDVIGTIRAHEVKVCLNQGCDFVFEPDYNLMPLEELDRFITDNKHLPEVAPASVMESEGINLSEMNAKLLQKIEELTLYTIEQNKKVENLSNLVTNQYSLINEQQKQIDEMKLLIKQ